MRSARKYNVSTLSGARLAPTDTIKLFAEGQRVATSLRDARGVILGGRPFAVLSRAEYRALLLDLFAGGPGYRPDASTQTGILLRPSEAVRVFADGDELRQRTRFPERPNFGNGPVAYLGRAEFAAMVATANPSITFDVDPGPGPDPKPAAGLSMLHASVLQPAQGMVRLGPNQHGVLSPLFTPDQTSIGVEIVMRRGRSVDRTLSIYQERNIAAQTTGWVLAIEMMPSSNGTPYAARARCVDQSGTIINAESTVTLSDANLNHILAWLTPTEIGISVNGEAPVVTPFARPTTFPTGAYAMIGDRHLGGGPFVPDADRYTEGDYHSLNGYVGADPAARPFDDAARAALHAAFVASDGELPEIASGTRTKRYKFDERKVIESIGGVDQARFLNGATIVDSPTPGTSGSPALAGTRVRTFGLGDLAFTFDPDTAPKVEEGPRRIEVEAGTHGSRDVPAFLGPDAPNVALQAHIPIPVPGSGDSRILTDVRPDGSSVGLEMAEGRYQALRVRDAGGSVVAEVVADDSAYHELTIAAVNKVELTTDYGSRERTRLELTVTGLDAGHRIANGDKVRLTDSGWSGAAYTVTFVSADKSVLHVVRSGFGHPEPALGSKVYATGDEFRASNTSSGASGHSTQGRYVALRCDVRDDGTVYLYSGGRLVKSGSIDPSLLAPADDVVCWLGGPPGTTATAMGLTLLLEHPGADADDKAALDRQCGELVDGRDGFLDDACFLKSNESVAIERVGPVDHFYEWLIMNPDGSDHLTTINPDTGQSWSRSTTPFDARRIGRPDLTETTVYPTRRTIFPKAALLSGLFNPLRIAKPVSFIINITRHPLGPIGKNIYLSKDHADADEDPDNDGTDPDRPLSTLNAAVDRSGPFDRVIMTAGEVFAGNLDSRGTGSVNGNQAHGRVRFEVGAAEDAGTTRVTNIELGGSVRTYLRGIHARDTSTDQNLVLGMSSGGASGTTGVLTGLTIVDCEAYNGGGGTCIGSNSDNYWGKNVLFERVRPRNETTNDTGGYAWFLGACDGLVMLGCDFNYRVQGGGGWPLRVMSITNSTISHVPGMTLGSLAGSKQTMSLRGNVWRVSITDWGDQSVFRTFVLLDAPPEIQTRGDLLVERIRMIADLDIWIANGVRISHARLSVNGSSTDATPSWSELVSARVRVFALHLQQNTTIYPNNTFERLVPTTGPWRSVATTGSDFGAIEAPSVAATHVEDGVAMVIDEGYPQSNTSTFRANRKQRKAAGSEAWDYIPGVGASHYTLTHAEPGYTLRSAVGNPGSELAFGAESDPVTVG